MASCVPATEWEIEEVLEISRKLHHTTEEASVLD